MSFWYEAESLEDVSIDTESGDLDVIFMSDSQGNHYASCNIEWVIKAMEKQGYKITPPAHMRDKEDQQ